MRYLKILLLLLFIACKKDSTNNCNDLSEAISQNDVQTVKKIVDEHINRLVIKDHTEENLQRLVTSLQQCGVAAELACYACVKTLPFQSEIKLASERIIDIGAVSQTDNTMRCNAMHE